MEIKLFSTRPDKFDETVEHTNELFCFGNYENPDFPFLYMAGGETLLIVALVDNKVMGGIQMSFNREGWLIEGVSTNDKPQWCMQGIGVNPDYQNKGVAGKLIAKQFEIMKQFDIDNICQSSYTFEGMLYVMPLYQKFITENPDINYLDFKRKF